MKDEEAESSNIKKTPSNMRKSTRKSMGVDENMSTPLQNIFETPESNIPINEDLEDSIVEKQQPLIESDDSPVKEESYLAAELEMSAMEEASVIEDNGVVKERHSIAIVKTLNVELSQKSLLDVIEPIVSSTELETSSMEEALITEDDIVVKGRHSIAVAKTSLVELSHESAVDVIEPIVSSTELEMSGMADASINEDETIFQ